MTGAMLAVLKAGDEVLVTDAVYKAHPSFLFFCDRRPETFRRPRCAFTTLHGWRRTRL